MCGFKVEVNWVLAKKIVSWAGACAALLWPNLLQGLSVPHLDHRYILLYKYDKDYKKEERTHIPSLYYADSRGLI